MFKIKKKKTKMNPSAISVITLEIMMKRLGQKNLGSLPLLKEGRIWKKQRRTEDP